MDEEEEKKYAEDVMDVIKDCEMIICKARSLADRHRDPYMFGLIGVLELYLPIILDDNTNHFLRVWNMAD